LVHSILAGESLPWEQDSGEAGELDQELRDLLMNESFEFDSELDQLSSEVADAISNLLRLSMSLRNPAPHDRFMSTEYAKVRYFEANDKAHVEAKFPRASQNLVIRLGQALSQRRQYFRYRESHHEKLARGLFDSGRSETGAQSTVASSIPLVMKVPGVVPVFGELDGDDRSDTGFSQTSFATTAPDSERLRIPPLPKKSKDGPFECPFCYMLVFVSSTHQWKKHVLRDLRPYVCLAEDCQVASREYGRRHDWMSHMLQTHWRSWACPHQCGSEYATEARLRQHVVSSHGSATEMELDTTIARCRQSQTLFAVFPVKCPLCCDITLGSRQQYQRHVGRHQVDLALFALPRIDDDEPDEESEDQEIKSTRSTDNSEISSDKISTTELVDPIESMNTIQEADSTAHSTQPSNSESRPRRDQLELDNAENEDNEGPQKPGHQRHEIPRVEETLEELGRDARGTTEGHTKGEAQSAIEENEDGKERKLIIDDNDIDIFIDNSGNENKYEIGEEQWSDIRHGDPSFLPGPSTSKVIRGPAIEREVITHYRDIDHGIAREKPPIFSPKLTDIPRLLVSESDSPEQRWIGEGEVEQMLAKDKLTKENRIEEGGKRVVEGDKKVEDEWLLEKGEDKKKRDEEYKRRMQEQLLKSGLDEEEINSILEGKKAERKNERKSKGKEEYSMVTEDGSRPTYTRMARRHLSLETLRVYDIDYVLDQDPEYVLIKRWVPEPEQDLLWRHTRVLREQRAGGPGQGTKEDGADIDQLDPNSEWVRKKKRGQRPRSPSPSLLMYLAGARPSSGPTSQSND
ncbi:hypothetical protein GGR51DRAFT_52331, partial [Nemania sp. FL0031]